MKVVLDTHVVVHAANGDLYTIVPYSRIRRSKLVPTI